MEESEKEIAEFVNGLARDLVVMVAKYFYLFALIGFIVGFVCGQVMASF